MIFNVLPPAPMSQECMYLHELGDAAASFTKEEMQQGKHTEYMNKLLAEYDLTSVSTAAPFPRANDAEPSPAQSSSSTDKTVGAHRSVTAQQQNITSKPQPQSSSSSSYHRNSRSNGAGGSGNQVEFDRGAVANGSSGRTDGVSSASQHGRRMRQFRGDHHHYHDGGGNQQTAPQPPVKSGQSSSFLRSSMKENQWSCEQVAKKSDSTSFPAPHSNSRMSSGLVNGIDGIIGGEERNSNAGNVYSNSNTNFTEAVVDPADHLLHHHNLSTTSDSDTNWFRSSNQADSGNQFDDHSDIDFDPFSESQQGLAELLAAEVNNHLDLSRSPNTHQGGNSNNNNNNRVPQPDLLTLNSLTHRAQPMNRICGNHHPAEFSWSSSYGSGMMEMETPSEFGPCSTAAFSSRLPATGPPPPGFEENRGQPMFAPSSVEFQHGSGGRSGDQQQQQSPSPGIPISGGFNTNNNSVCCNSDPCVLTRYNMMNVTGSADAFPMRSKMAQSSMYSGPFSMSGDNNGAACKSDVNTTTHPSQHYRQDAQQILANLFTTAFNAASAMLTNNSREQRQQQTTIGGVGEPQTSSSSSAGAGNYSPSTSPLPPPPPPMIDPNAFLEHLCRQSCFFSPLSNAAHHHHQQQHHSQQQQSWSSSSGDRNNGSSNDGGGGGNSFGNGTQNQNTALLSILSSIFASTGSPDVSPSANFTSSGESTAAGHANPFLFQVFTSIHEMFDVHDLCSICFK